jgi:predicted permease
MRPHGIRAGVQRLVSLPLRSREQSDADADDELRALIDERTDYLVARGMSEPDARAQAVARLGQSLAETEQILHTSAALRERRLHLREMVEDLVQDLRYTARTLRRDAGFTALAVTIIGLGIGASATVFSVANTLLIRPLPFHEANDLVWIGNKPTGGELAEWATVSSHYLDLTEQTRTLSGLAAFNAFFRVGDTHLGGEMDAVRVSRVQVTPNFFPLLGVAPILGRTFLPEESRDSAQAVVMLSHALWTQRFASDQSILGKTILMNDVAATVVGVLPASFDFGSVFAPGAHIDLFTPFPLTAQSSRRGNTLALVGRRKPGIPLATAVAELTALGARLTREHPERNAVIPMVMSLRAHVSGSVQSAIALLMVAVGVVMLIVCANLSNLLLVRATTRQREMAIRAALGAGRGRLLRQMLTESVALSTFGALLGWLLAVLGTRAISRTNAIDLPLLESIHVDATALVFIAGLAIAAGLLFGLAPAMQLRETALHDVLKASGRSATDSRRGQFVRRSLVVSEIALACVLLVGSGLLFRSFVKLLDVDLGFAPEHLVSVRVDPDPEHRTSQEVFIAYLDEVLRLTKEIPGVQRAAVSDILPLGGNRSWSILARGHVYEKGQRPESFIHVASDNYIGTLGIKLVAGRDFTRQDGTTGAPVIIINQSAARTLFPGENPIGQFVGADRGEREVIGVVRDVRHLGLDKAAGLEVYIPLRQTSDFSSLNLVVRTTLTPSAFATAIHSALKPMIPNLPTNQIQTLSGLVDKSVSPRRFFTSMIGAFALIALGLALLGIYGVVSYTVSHRTQEIGIRIALGASPRQIQGRIIRETMELAVAGIALGTLGSWLLSRTLSGFLFGVSSLDPATFVAMLVIVTAVALVSGYAPARRASRIDPSVAFRAS